MNKEIKGILKTNRQLLENSEKDLKAIFQIMFRLRGSVLCETNNGFRIQTHTYGEIFERICHTANALYAKVGAQHHYIALEMENSPDWIVAFWAILMSGNKPYLVNTRYPEHLSNAILERLRVKYILCENGTQLVGETIALSDLTGEYPCVPEEVFENELAFSSSATSMNEVICFYTGLQIAEQILNFEQIVKESPRIAKHYKGQLKQLAFLPFYHVFGLFAVYFWFTFFGRTLVFLQNLSPETILKTCRRHHVTHIFAVPALWHTVESQIWAEVAKQKKEAQLRKALNFFTKLQNICPSLGAELAKYFLHQVTDKLFGRSVMFCISGGSYLRNSTMELLNGIGYCLHNGYGMSEIGITSVELRRRPKDRNLNSVGHPFSSVEYRLNEEGILQVRGSSLCVKKQINENMVVLDGWFDTDDRMKCIDGHYYILGRRSDTVIGENGENINPDMVEKAFLLNEAKRFCVLGLPGKNGQELSMIVQLGPYTTQSRMDRIKEEIYQINQGLPMTVAVKKFYFTHDDLAPASAIKVSRAQLMKKIENGEVNLMTFQQYTAKKAAEGQQSPIFPQVQKIIAQVLEMDKGEITEESHIFYDLGATSIQYFSILTKLSQHFSFSDYESSDTYCYTPKEICEYLERKL